MKEMITPVLTQATTLNQVGFTRSPMMRRLLTRSSMKTSTTGIKMPLTSCEKSINFTSGRPGTSTAPAPRTIDAV